MNSEVLLEIVKCVQNLRDGKNKRHGDSTSSATHLLEGR